MATSFSPSSLSFGATTAFKQKSLDEKRQEKYASIEWKSASANNLINSDGDSGTLPDGTPFRLATGQDGFSFDAFDYQPVIEETDTPDDIARKQKKYDRQANAAGRLLNKDPLDVTAEDLATLDQQGKDRFSAALFKGQEAPTDGFFPGYNPQVEHRTIGKDQFGRDLVELRNPVTGETLLNSLNTPENNSSYDSNFNYKQRDSDLLAVQKLAADKKSKALFPGDNAASEVANQLVNLVAGGTSLTAGILSLPFDAVSAVVEFPVAPEDKKAYTGVQEKNNLHSAYTQAMKDVENPESVKGQAELRAYKEARDKIQFSPEEKAIFQIQEGEDKSIFDKLEVSRKSQKLPEMLDSISHYIDERVDHSSKDEATQRLIQRHASTITGISDSWDKLINGDAGASIELTKGIGTLIAGFGDVGLNNPMAAVDVLVQSIPEIYAIMKSAPWVAAVIAKHISDGVDEFQEAHDDRNPDAKEFGIIVATNATSVLIDRIGAKGALGLSKSAERSAEKAVLWTADKIRVNAKKQSKAMLKAIKAKRTVQSKAAARLNANPAQKAVNLVGDVAGIGLTGVKAVALSPTVKKAARGVKSEAPTEFVQGALEEFGAKQAAISFQDAYVGGVLGGLAGGGLGLAGAAPEETIRSAQAIDSIARTVSKTAKNLVIPKELVTAAQTAAKTGDYSAVSDPAKSDPFNEARAIITNPPTDTQNRETVKAWVQAFTKATVDNNALLSEERIKLAEQYGEDLDSTAPEVKDFNKRWNEQQKLLEQVVALTSKDNLSPANINAAIKEAVKGTEGIAEAVLGTVGMTSSATPEVLAKLEEFKAKANLSAEQIDALEKRLVSLETLNKDDVSKEILYGNMKRKNLGLVGHQQNISNAILSGNVKAVQKSLDLLTTFAQGLRTKADTATAAYQAAISGDQAKANAILEKAGLQNDLNIHKGSNKSGFVDTIFQDAEIAEAFLADSTAQVNLAFDGITPTPTEQVQEAAAPAQRASKPVPTTQSTKTEKEPVKTKPTAPETTSNATTTVQPKTTKPAKTSDAAVQEKSATEKVAKNKKINESISKHLPPEIFGLELTSKAYKDIVSRIRTAVLDMEKSTGKAATNAQVKILVDQIKAGIQLAQEGKPKSKAQNSGARVGYAYAVKHGLTYSIKNDLYTNRQIAGELEENTQTRVNKNNHLHTIKKFFSSVFGKEVDYSLISEPLTEAEKTTLASLNQFVTLFNENFKNTLNNTNSFSTWQKDFSKLMLNEFGLNDENVSSTLALVGYEWLTTLASSTMSNKDGDINKILRRDSDANVAPSTRTLLQYAGFPRTDLAESLGTQAINNLGIKLADSTKEGNYVGKLKLAVGQHILDTLVSMEIVEQHHRTKQEMDSIQDDKLDNLAILSPFTQPGKGNVNFIRLASQTIQNQETGNNELIPSTASINWIGLKDAEVNVGKQGRDLISKLFTKRQFGQEHSWVKPVKADMPTKMKNSNAIIPKDVFDANLHYSQIPQEINQDTYSIFSLLSSENQNRIAGYVDDVENSAHEFDREKQNTINADIELDQFKFNQFVADALIQSDGLNTPFYLISEVWKNIRSGMTSSSVNSQTSKYHRMLIKQQSRTTEIDSTNIRLAFLHKKAVAQSLGLPVDNLTDKNLDTELTALWKSTKGKVIQAGVEAINTIKATGTTPELKKAVVDAVDAGGETGHSFEGIISLAKEQAAEGKPFVTNLGYEIDGKTNGPIIGIYQLAAAKNEADLKNKLARGGLFTDDTTSYADYKSNPANLDTYEALSTAWRTALRSNKLYSDTRLRSLALTVGSFYDQKLKSVSDLGRKLSKAPTMETAFGAQIENTVDSMSEGSLSALYASITKIKDDPVALADMALNLNTALNTTGFILTSKNALIRFTPEQERAYINIMNDVYGQALEIALEAEFSDFIQMRSNLNSAMKLVFEGFSITINKKIKVAKELKGGVLSPEERTIILEEVIEVTPLINSYFSTELSEAIEVYKTAKTRPDLDENLQQVFRKKRDVFTSFDSSGKGQIPTDSVSAKIAVRDFVDGGLFPVIGIIHSLDAATMYKTIMDSAEVGIDVMNIFDAIIVSLDSMDTTSEIINKNFTEAMQYDLMGEFSKTLSRAIQNLDSTVLAVINNRLANGEMHLLINGVFMKTYQNFQSGLLDVINVAKVKQTPIFAEGGITFVDQYVGTKPYTMNAPFTSELAQTLTDEEIEVVTAEAIENIANETKLGSSQQLDPNTFTHTHEDNVTTVNSEQIFDDLGNQGNIPISQEHSNHLKSQLTNLINKTDINNIIFRRKLYGRETHAATANNTIVMDIGSGDIYNQTQMSAQEAYLHELMHIVTRHALDNNKNGLREEVRRLRDSVAPFFSAQDFLTYKANGDILVPPGSTELDELNAANIRYEYIFFGTPTTTYAENPVTKKQIATHKNNSLHEFVAFGTTNETFMNKLASAELNQKRKADKLFNKNPFIWMANISRAIMNFIHGQITGTRGLPADKKLQVLAEQLAGVHERKTMRMFGDFDFEGRVATPAVEGLRYIITAPILALAKSNLVQNNLGTKAGKVGRTVTNYSKVSWTAFKKVSWEAAKRIGISEKNMFLQLVREMEGGTAENRYIHHIIASMKTALDSARERNSRELTSMLSQKFNIELSKDDKQVLTSTILRTDSSELLSDYSIKEINDFLVSSTLLDQEIAKIKAKMLAANPNNGYFYLDHSISLGESLVTGMPTIRDGYLNTHLIAKMAGHANTKLDGDLVTIEKQLDNLTSLIALAKLPMADKAITSSIITREFGDTKLDDKNADNGITFLFQTAEYVKKNALEENFSGKKGLMRKGFTKEIYDPNVSFVVAPESMNDELRKEGYTRSKHEMPKDKNDNNKGIPVYFYTHNDGMTTGRVSTAVSFLNQSGAGTDLISAYGQAGSTNPYLQGTQDIDGMKQENARDYDAQFKPGSSLIQDETIATPLRDENGNIVNYRYMMTEHNKDKILRRDNAFDTILGNMSADIIVKPEVTEINARTVKEVHEEYVREIEKSPDEFVAIGPQSTDPDLIEIYRLMPPEMRREVEQVWGGKTMYVKAKHVHLLFAFKKWSFKELGKDITQSDRVTNNLFKKLTIGVADLLGSRVGKLFENGLQEIIKIVKDFIVIKSGIVLKDNIVSNNFLLWSMGLSMKEILAYQTEGIENILKYTKDSRELFRLEKELEINPNMPNKRSVQNKINNLKVATSNNPVKPLIDSGVFQTIMEDIDTAESQYTYKGKLEDKFEGAISKVPKSFKIAGQQIFLTHETDAYNVLKHATQFSDFVARYAMHKYNLDPKNNTGMTEAESIDDIVDTFINYDLPTGKALQYVNDMGLVMFTKFYLRIQKVWAKALIKSPARILATVLGSNFITDFAHISESALALGELPGSINPNPLEHVQTVLETNLAAYLFGIP